MSDDIDHLLARLAAHHAFRAPPVTLDVQADTSLLETVISKHDLPDALFAAMGELTRLRAENERLREAGSALFAVVDGELREVKAAQDAGFAGLKDTPESLAKKHARDLYLRCQADVSAVGTRSSPSALQKSAGDDAEEWAECGFGICEDCGAGLIDDFQCLRCKWQERRRMGLKVWRPCECHLHEHQVCDLCQGVPKRIPRPIEEPRSGDTATAAGRDVGLTPHSNPQERTQDG